MKNIADKLKSGLKSAGDVTKKYLTKAAVGLGVTAIGLAAAYNAGAQTVEANYKTPLTNVPAGVTITHDSNLHVQTQVFSESKKDAMYNEFMNTWTNEIDKPVDLYNAPMGHVKLNEKNKLDYLYSGDVNNDEVIDSKDPQEIYMGTRNERAKVLLNENISSADGKALEDKLSGERERIPGEAFMDISATQQEKVDLFYNFMNRADFKADWELIQTAGGDCEFASFYAENRGRGVEHPEANKNYNPNVLGKRGEGNMPIFGVGTVFIEGAYRIEHMINGAFTGESNNTDMRNVLRFNENYTMIEPQTGKIEAIGGVRLNETAEIRVNEPVIINGEILGSGAATITFDIRDKDLPNVTNFDPRFALTNPKAIQTEFAANEEGTINYKSNMDLTNKGMPSIKTNADLVSRIKFNEDINECDASNFLVRTVIEGPKVPLSVNPELSDINFKQDKEVVVSYFQKTQMKRGISYVLLKEDRFNTSITVDDLEAPAGQLSQTGDKAEPGIRPAELAKKYVTNVTDNSGIAVDTITTVSDIPTWSDNLYDYYDVNVALMDKRGNKKDLGDFEAGIRKFPTGIEELVGARSFDLDQNYPNPVMNITTIPYFSNSEVQFVLFDSQGKTIKEFKTEPGFSGEYEIQINMTGMKTGTYFLSGTSNNKTDKISILKK